MENKSEASGDSLIQLEDGTLLQYNINTQSYHVVEVEMQYNETQEPRDIIECINDSSTSFDEPSPTIPKYRNAIGEIGSKGCKSVQQPSSMIPMSSVFSTISSSNGSSSTPTTLTSSIGFNYDFECKSPKLNKGSATLNSQCSLGRSNESGIKIWTYETTVTFISLVEKHQEAFKKQLKKKVWNSIASVLSNNLKINVTGQQCDTKWKGLVDMYKKIKKHNDTSGNERKDWEFWDKLDAILIKRPEISPVATCSSYRGLVLKNIQGDSDDSTQGSNSHQWHKDSTETSRSPVNEDSNEENVPETSNSKFVSRMSKRKCRVDNPTERRHKEKLARQDRFLDLFEKYLEQQK